MPNEVMVDSGVSRGLGEALPGIPKRAQSDELQETSRPQAMFIPKFQVTDCARPVMSVRVQTAVGNFVVFRPQKYLRPVILQQFEQDERQQLEESTWWKNRQFLVETSESQMMALGVEDRLFEKVFRFAKVEERKNQANEEKPVDVDKTTSVPT